MTEIAHVAASRHRGVRDLAHWLDPNPNLPVRERDLAQAVCEVAITALHAIPADSAELTAGLRKLLEAKDCLVRASLETPPG